MLLKVVLFFSRQQTLKCLVVLFYLFQQTDKKKGVTMYLLLPPVRYGLSKHNAKLLAS
jgi:hypothetical protein